MRRIFIGDIHGCNKELNALIKELKLKSDDEVYCTGDLIELGYDSVGVIRTLQKYGIKSVLGNHDIKFMKAYEKKKKDEHDKHVLEKISKFTHERKEIYNYLKECPRFFVTADFILVHACLEPNKHSILSMNQDIISGVDPKLGHTKWWQNKKFDTKVIVGHTSGIGVINENNVVVIDTACVFGGELTAYILDTDSFVSVRSKFAIEGTKPRERVYTVPGDPDEEI